jgi:hypothetical protein
MIQLGLTHKFDLSQKADPTIAIAARFIRKPGKYPKPNPK